MSEPSTIPLGIVLVARCFLGGFLLLSALGKLRDLRGFIRGTIAYKILPEPVARACGYVLPWAELLLALALLAGVALPIAGLLIVGLLGTFSLAISINLHRGRQIACHCHGLAGTQTISWGAVARNLLLMLIAGSLALLAPHALEFERWQDLWRADLSLLSTGVASVLLALLLAFCFVVLQLAEWTMHIYVQFARLKEQVR